MSTLASPATTARMARMASTLSSWDGAACAAEAADGRGAGGTRGELAGAEGGRAAGACAVAGAAVAGAAEAGAAAADTAGVGAAGLGILIVGAAVGFGGRLMRTVSFLGCTFALSAGLGGVTPPGGTGGLFSDIKFCWANLDLGVPSVNPLSGNYVFHAANSRFFHDGTVRQRGSPRWSARCGQRFAYAGLASRRCQNQYTGTPANTISKPGQVLPRVFVATKRSSAISDAATT